MVHASGNKEIAVNVEFVENTTSKGYFIVFQHNTSGLPDAFRAVPLSKATTTLEDLPAGTYTPVFYDLERDGLPNVSPASLSTVILSIQVNKKFFELKNVEYRDGIKSKETRQG